MNKRYWLLATSAIIGLTPTFGFAQVEDQANPGVAIATTPFMFADRNKNLVITGTSAEIQLIATLSLGNAVADGIAAIEALNSTATTTLTLNNATASGNLSATVLSGDSAASFQSHATQALDLNLTTVANRVFSITTASDTNLNGGTLTLAPNVGGGRLNATFEGDINAGAIRINSTNEDVAATFRGDINAPIIAITHDEFGNTENIVFSGNNALTVDADIVADSAGDMAGGTLVITGSGTNATFNGNIGTTSAANMALGGIDSAQSIVVLNVQSNAEATFNETTDVSFSSTVIGTLNNNGTFTLGGNINGNGSINNTGTFTLGGNLNGSNTFTNDGTANINGNILGNGSFINNGTLTVINAVSALSNFTNTNLATINGNVTTTGMLTNSGTLNLLGNVTGAATLTNTGTLNITGTNNAALTNSGTATLNNANSATINNTGTLNFSSANTGTINNAGTFIPTTTIDNTGGVIDLASIGTATLDAQNFANGQSIITGGTVNLNGTLDVLLNPNFVEGDSITIADATGANTGNLAANIGNIQISSVLNQIIIDASSGVTATVGPANTPTQISDDLGISLAESAKVVSASIAAANGEFSAADPAFAPFEAEIVNSLTGTTAQARAIAERLGDATATAGAVTDAAASTFTTAKTNIDHRLASLRAGEASLKAGVAAGNSAAHQNMWFEATASTLDQGRRKGAAGFEVGSVGGTIGYDAETSATGHAGLAFSYNYSDIEGDSNANVDSQVNTYLLTFYTGKEFGNGFLNSAIHYGLNDVKTAQTSDVRREGSYVNEQFGAALDLGYNIHFNKNNRLVPSIGLNFTRTASETVTLRDTTGTNPDITDNISKRDLFIGKIGAQYEHDYHADDGGLFRSALHGHFLYDFASDEVTSIRNFGGGVTVQDTQAEIAEKAFNVGATFTYESANKDTAIQFGYEADLKDKFVAHTGAVRVSFRF